jgi:hypothetical protein
MKLFEAFGNKSVGAIEKFLKLLDSDDVDNFVDILKSISTKMDIPLSNFKGDYVKALTAMKMNVEGEQLIKFWFSVEDGLLGMTTTKSFSKDQLSFRKFNNEEDWMKTAFIQNFISNNLIVDEHLRELRWTERSYGEIMNAQFALVVNLTELSKGLKSLKSKRIENRKGAMALFSDDYIRLKNQQKRKDILQKKRGITDYEIMDLMFDIMKKYRCHDPMDILDVCFELYYKGKIDGIVLDGIQDYIKNKMDGISGRGSRRIYTRMMDYDGY